MLFSRRPGVGQVNWFGRIGFNLLVSNYLDIGIVHSVLALRWFFAVSA
jgi:hypothetical protein